MAKPTVLIVFGATGDLVRRKIVPALWHLFLEGKLPAGFSAVGFSRRELAPEAYRDYIRAFLPDKAARRAPDFLKLFGYVRGLFDDKEAYRLLGKALADIETKSGASANKLFYLAVTPDMYRTVLTHIAASGLAVPCADDSGRTPPLKSAGKRELPGAQPISGAGWTRIIVEKPFGKDADTAQALDELLGKLFREEQIYRIDHYLAKEMIQNIPAFRFSNNLFEKNWGAEAIERIDIRLWERIGVEERGAFYDGVGALRDVGQNHLLQMLALVTMERPDGLAASDLRARRAEMLRTLVIPSRREIRKTSARAVPGIPCDSRGRARFPNRNLFPDIRAAGGVPLEGSFSDVGVGQAPRGAAQRNRPYFPASLALPLPGGGQRTLQKSDRDLA